MGTPSTLATDAPSLRQPRVKPRQSLSVRGIGPLPWPLVTPPDDRPRVLFVEDEASILEPFSRALAREGFEPIPARTVAEALQRAAETPPDVVLLDVMLPDGDGRDVLRELRATSDVPVIMLTARGTETDRVVGLELGADDYVVKPFSGAEVVARLRAVLRRTRRRAGAGRSRRRTSPSGRSPSSRPPGARSSTGAELSSAARSSTCSPI